MEAYACRFLRQLSFLGEAEAQALKPGRYLRYLLTQGGTVLGRAAVDNIWQRRCLRAERRVKSVQEFWNEFKKGGYFSQDAQDAEGATFYSGQSWGRYNC
jgi:hypothetical protein